MSESINQMLDRFQKYPGAMCIDNPKASVYHIARHILGEVRDRPIAFPVSPAALISATYKEGWFVESMYSDAIACLVHVDALVFDGEKVNKGPTYDVWLTKVDRHREYVRMLSEALDKRTYTYAEGRAKAIEEFVPAGIRSVLEGYPQTGILVNSRNIHKRAQPGVRCYVEFGKRHFSWNSEITGRRETVSAIYYALGEVVKAPDQGKTTVRVNGVEVSVENYRITKVIQEA